MEEHPAAFVTVTVYDPAIAAVAFGLVGFWAVLVHPPGPLQLYDVPPEAVRLMVAPAHTGLLEPADALGNGLTVTTLVAVPVHLIYGVMEPLHNQLL